MRQYREVNRNSIVGGIKASGMVLLALGNGEYKEFRVFAKTQGPFFDSRGLDLTDVVPFLVEDMLKANGGDYSKGADWGSWVVTDGKLVTGQNPASSREAAEALLKLL